MTRALAILGLLAACSEEAPPAADVWGFSKAVPTKDGCNVAASLTTEPAKWERKKTTEGEFRWEPSGDAHGASPYFCQAGGKKAACFARAYAWDDHNTSAQLWSWLRGTFSDDDLSFSGGIVVAGSCGTAVCPPAAGGPALPCTSEIPFTATALVEKEPGDCPPDGTKSVEGGTAATLTLRQASGNGDLKLGQLDGATGSIVRAMPIDSTERVVLQDYPTTIGIWYVVFTESAGTKSCEGAFRIDGPDTRIVLKDF